MTAEPGSIRILPPALVQRIAAGEVIERPASVVKELVENALDAGARAIRVDIQGGGLELIRVRDDGRGIPTGQLALACSWHATSKLADDSIDAIQTLGFRGEALPSIALVGELEIVSRCLSDETGRRLLAGGDAATESPAPHPPGTTVTVRRLFEHVPARRASLAPARAELAQITQVLRRLALASPEVAFSCWSERRPLLRTSAAGDLAATMVEVYGESLLDRLVALGPVEARGARLSGLVAGAELTRAGRAQVNVIVNGRWVQPRGLLAALESAYRPVLPRGRHPVALLRVELDPRAVNVNVHPTKLEVRLTNERAIGTALGELIRDALGRRPLELRGSPAAGLNALGGVAIAEDAASYDAERPIQTPNLPTLTLVGQLQRRLIVLESPNGLWLIDQHRAHERVLYERLLAAESAREEPEELPEPLLLELRPAQARRFAARRHELESLGFGCEEFGGHTFLLRRAPALPGVLGAGAVELPNFGEADYLREALLGALEGDPGEGETWRERLLVALSCRTALRRGRELDRPSMRALVAALGACRSPAVCPHGSPLLLQIGEQLLERQFDW
ncbi:MAG TPA: DNA mismatch repair endonuclease MutL [Thermomicrobiaceae bacterium]|nr:DNA mismatch repair endonuclease MutL [Thermomicrobiaceae bacterium]